MITKFRLIIALLFVVQIAAYATTLTVNVRAFLEGRYNPQCHCMIADTVDILLYFRDQTESQWLRQRGELDEGGAITVTFTNVPDGTFFLGIQHKNSIRTWSMPINSTSSTLAYDFTTASSKAYFWNMNQKSDGKWCIISGNVDRDNSIDINDMMLVQNDIEDSISGYVITDLDGNGIIDNTDYIIVCNNAAQYAQEHKPVSSDFGPSAE